jgi:ankyrin repeat protein
VLNNDLEMVKLLLKNGADKKIKTVEGEMALDIATKSWRTDIKKVLEDEKK